jgi:cell division protein FtsL
MTKSYVLLFLLVLTIPLFLGINAWQANKCGEIRNEIKHIEREQEDRVNENKTAANEIINLLAADRLDTEAQKLGLRKMRPEGVILIVMGGKGRGR